MQDPAFLLLELLIDARRGALHLPATHELEEEVRRRVLELIEQAINVLGSVT